MKYQICLFISLWGLAGFAQPVPKPAPKPAPVIIPGIFKISLHYAFDDGSFFRFSPSGHTLAVKADHNRTVFYEPAKGKETVVTTAQTLSGISPDQRYVFDNGLYYKPGTYTYEPAIITKGIYTDTMMRYITGTWIILGMDAQNNLIVTKPVTDELRATRKIGIYRLDRITGKEIETLRTDTLCTDGYTNECGHSIIKLKENSVVISKDRNAPLIRILPFGSKQVIKIVDNDHYGFMTDSSFVYTLSGNKDGITVKAYDLFTGKVMGKKLYPHLPDNYDRLYYYTQNKIYHFNPAEGKIYEDEAKTDTIITKRSWDVSASISLSRKQDWQFVVGKGPQFLFAPLKLEKGEAGGVEVNAALLFHTASKKVMFTIYPFYNRTPDDVAKQAKAKQEWDEYLANNKKQKEANDPCKIGWNVEGYKRGITRKLEGGTYVVLSDFDCVADRYTVWRPAQSNTSSVWDEPHRSFTMSGYEMRKSKLGDKQYHTCSECAGSGTREVTTYTTKTKELPWGYFSGIETKRISTTSETHTELCKICLGRGVILK